MNLDELNTAEPETSCEVSDDTDEDFEAELQTDLETALALLISCLEMMEDITLLKGRIIKHPKHMLDLMEEVSEFIDTFPDSDSDPLTGPDVKGLHTDT